MHDYDCDDGPTIYGHMHVVRLLESRLDNAKHSKDVVFGAPEDTAALGSGRPRHGALDRKAWMASCGPLEGVVLQEPTRLRLLN
jgi:hypothetical protein